VERVKAEYYRIAHSDDKLTLRNKGGPTDPDGRPWPGGFTPAAGLLVSGTSGTPGTRNSQHFRNSQHLRNFWYSRPRSNV
jgi:hypothetical protein